MERARVAVVGAGTMGSGIAQVALEAGQEVALLDVADGAFERGRQRIRDGLERRARKRALDATEAEAWVGERLGRLYPALDLAEATAGTGLVIEAVVEDLALKQRLFTDLVAATGPATLLATNTSALSVTAIASGGPDAARILGLHFFNPAPLMALVEVVSTPRTDPALAERAAATMRAWGKTPVRCADTPGFIVNRVNRPFTIEALRILESGLASVEQIDDALVAAGFPMGPFTHMDLVGLDVNLAAARALHEALGRPDRLAPSTIQARLLAAGQLGRKTGQGFYRYDDKGRSVGPAAGFVRADDTPAWPAPTTLADRIMHAVTNEAFFALRDGVATADDIDLALRLGAGYPIGPIAWAHERGLDRVRDGLLALREAEGDRFSPAPALDDAAASARG